MPNQRQAGTKLAGAYISADKDKALAVYDEARYTTRNKNSSISASLCIR